MSINQLLQALSPEVREFVEDKIENIEDKDLLSLSKTFQPFPSSERRAPHPDEDDWFVLPQYLEHIPHSKSPTGEGLRMVTWQTLIFAEVKARGLGTPQFWSREEIKEDRSSFIKSLIKESGAKDYSHLFYDKNEDDFPEETEEED